MGNVSLIDGHIDESKLTDNEIKKALEQKIKFSKEFDESEEAIVKVNVLESSLDLINRLEAENKRLKAQVHRLKQYDEERDIALHARLIATARAEAAKEFAEGLKEKACSYDLPNYHSFDAVTVEDIDDFAKGMEKKYNDNRADN